MASDHLRVPAIPATAVDLRDEFWAPRRRISRDVGLPRLLERLEENGVIDNFRGQPRRGLWFTDSDLYKWMEAAAWHPELAGLLDPVVDAVVSAQGPDGYLNTAFGAHDRYGDLGYSHEMYCAGHLIEAAVAHQRAVGDERLMGAAVRLADHLWDTFGPDGRQETDGHPEIELALVALYRQTGTSRYLELADLLCRRAHPEMFDELWGHAVRVCYMASGIADVYIETGDTSYREVLDRWWASLVEAKIYVTGGVGGRWIEESVGRAYELPNEGSYAETCAAIAAILWARRMLAITGEAAYADQLERTMYNGFLAGVSLDGDAYHYANPLAAGGRGEYHPERWEPWTFQRLPIGRQSWFPVTCCPTNVNRLLATLPEYFYGADSEGPWVHLFATSQAQGDGWRLKQNTGYPWDGRVELTVGVESPIDLTIRVRVPGWCKQASAGVDGVALDQAVIPGSYLAIRRRWEGGERVTLQLQMEPFFVACNPRVAENRGSLAIQRGPLIYCLEGPDNPGVNVLDALVDDSTPLAAEYRPDLLGGLTAVTARGLVPTEPWGPLYRPLAERHRRTREVTLTAIPYYAWGNRGISTMTVWPGRAGNA
ncbi:MAG: beta-L-arabinofuranosidase domain-containing protein [Actinomycetota bacterium]